MLKQQLQIAKKLLCNSTDKYSTFNLELQN